MLNHTGLTLMLEPITFSSNRHNTRMVQEAIQQCSRQRGILGKDRSHWPNGRLRVTMNTLPRRDNSRQTVPGLTIAPRMVIWARWASRMSWL